jgi:PIN domain nuclease of toxin-antitoxin system
MSKKVLDSSAILAVIFQEKGSEIVEPLLDKSLISSVNVAEVFTKLAEKGILTQQMIDDFWQLGLEIVDFNFEQSVKVAELRPLTKHLGLSLGDRSCLALAILQNTTAVTADKEWAKLSFCQVEVIR